MPKIEFYTIYYWMREELGLKDTELDCYAVIYCLSLGENRYIAGVKNLMQILQKSEPTIISVLKSLTKKGLISKEPVVVNNVKRNYYKALRPSKGTKEILGTTLNDLSTPTLNDLSGINNINIENKKNNKKEGKSISNDIPKKPIQARILTDDEERFYAHMEKDYPYVQKMKEPLTFEQYMRLHNEFEYSFEQIEDELARMDNYPNLHKCGRGAYRTALNWLKRDNKKESA